ncbi:hypothetical protein AB205_0092110, partial [Aquarana catesbeiana]
DVLRFSRILTWSLEDRPFYLVGVNVFPVLLGGAQGLMSCPGRLSEKELLGELSNSRAKFHVLFLLFVALMFFLSLMFLFGYHCWLVSLNRTTLGKLHCKLPVTISPFVRHYNSRAYNYKDVNLLKHTN